MMRNWLTVAAVLACGGCSGDGEVASPRPSGDAGGSSAGAAAGGSGSAGAAAGGSGDGGTASAGMAAAVLEAPATEQALVAFLNAKQYSSWPKEAEYHASAGPHGGDVRVFYSPKAAQSLNDGAPTFAAGSAAVKELTSGGSLYGWAVWVKVQDATDDGNGFYWYELIHQGGGKDNVYGNALGSPDCVGCHAAGKDYDLSTLPFE